MIICTKVEHGQYNDPNGRIINAIFYGIWQSEFPKYSLDKFLAWAEPNIPCKFNQADYTIDIEESVYTLLLLKYL
jgi:hypothetical protein